MTTFEQPGSGTARFESGAGVPVMTWPVFESLPVRALVSTRDGGVSGGPYSSLNLGLHVGDEPARVLENRRRVAAAIGAGLDDLVFCQQSHEPVVRVVTAADRGRGARREADALGGTDALVTTDPGVVLVVMVADCVPLVLFDPTARVLACVHAGWRGTVLGVTPAAVTAMRELGADAGRIVAGIGPAVDPGRYQVGPDVVGPARTAFGDRVDDVLRPDDRREPGSGERWLFDLWAANRLQLLGAGVPAGQIQVAGLGTGPGTPFFSHRFEGPCGRFAALARLG